MSEKDRNEQRKIQIPVERHKWPDEIEAEKKQRRSKKISFAIFAFIFITIGTFIGVKGSSQLNSYFGMNKIGEVEKILSEKWYFGKDIENIDEYLSDKSIRGMLDFPEIDKHSSYMSKEEMEQYSQNLSGSYVGIGIQYYQDENDNFVVRKVFPASPAAKAGILPGDILISVDQHDIRDKTLDDIKSLVLGEEDTEVAIGVVRAGKKQTFKMNREKVAHSVNYETVAKDTGYIELTQFGESTAKEVDFVLDSFQKEGHQKLIIDLRDNGGGYLTSVVDIAGYFIGDNEVVLYQEVKNGKQSPEKTDTDITYDYSDIILLVNENTASASEVLVAALQHHLDNVRVVGTKSYGKGTVQTTKMLGDGSALKYTVAEWLTPAKDKINNVGITPDLEVKLHPILTSVMSEFEPDLELSLDSVDPAIATAQSSLDFLGYNVGRTDGYFDKTTQEALINFQTDHNLNNTGVLTREDYEILSTSVVREWSLNQDKYDKQLKEAVRLIHE